MIDTSNYNFLKVLEHNANYVKYKFERTCEFMDSTSRLFPDLCEMIYKKLGVVATVWEHKLDNNIDLQFLTNDFKGYLTKDVLFFNENSNEHPFCFITVPLEHQTEDEIADQFIRRISSRTMFEWDWLGKKQHGKTIVHTSSRKLGW